MTSKTAVQNKREAEDEFGFHGIQLQPGFTPIREPCQESFQK
jgi:hypothetical protein